MFTAFTGAPLQLLPRILHGDERHHLVVVACHGCDPGLSVALALRVWQVVRALDDQTLCTSLEAAGVVTSRTQLRRWLGGDLKAAHIAILAPRLEQLGWLRHGSPPSHADIIMRDEDFDRISEWASIARITGWVGEQELMEWEALTGRVVALGRGRVGEGRWLMCMASLVSLAEQINGAPRQGAVSQLRAMGIAMQAEDSLVDDGASLVRHAAVVGRIHHCLAQAAGRGTPTAQWHARRGAARLRRAHTVALDLGSHELAAAALADESRLASMLQPQRNPEATAMASRAFRLARDAGSGERMFTASLAMALSHLVAGTRTSTAQHAAVALRSLDQGLEPYAGRWLALPPLWRHFIHIHRGLALARLGARGGSLAELSTAAEIGSTERVVAWVRSATRLALLVDRPVAMLDSYRYGAP